MANPAAEAYKKLAKEDKNLSIAKRNYDNLQKQLNELESIQLAGTTTLENLQKDINTLNHRLINNEIDINKECSELEEKYGDLASGNTLPDTLEEMLSLAGEEKINADKELKRIVEAHHGGDDYTLDGFTALKKRLNESEQAIFEAQLNYGQLPEKEEELYALNEADPKDKQTIEMIMKLLNQDAAASSQKTWEETKKEYQNIKNDYAAIRNAQKGREEQLQNLLKADLNTLRQQQTVPASPVENSEIITEESKILINGELKKNAATLGISSLDEYFTKEKELHAAKPETSAIDDLPDAAHFFTSLSRMSAEQAAKARRITNDLIKKHRETHPQTAGAADSVEDYENSEKIRASWEDRRKRLSRERTSQGLIAQDIINELPESELQRKVLEYNHAQTERENLEKELAVKSLDVHPVKVAGIKDLKKSDPLKYEVFSAKVKAIAEDDSLTLISSLSGRSYDAETLIQEHDEMLALEKKNKDKTQLLTEQEYSRLQELQGRVREMKDRLEEDKKKNTNFFGHHVFTNAQITEQNQLKSRLEQKKAEIKTLEGDMAKLADAEVEKSTKEARIKKDYIKHTVVEPEQQDASSKKKAFEKKEEAHKKLTEKVDGILTNLKKDQQKKLAQHDAALQREEDRLTEQNKNAYVNAASTRSMVEVIKEVNTTRKNTAYWQHRLDDITATNTETMKQLNRKLEEIKTNVETWVKDDKDARTKNIQIVNEGLTKEMSAQIKTANKEARKAGTNAKVMGFVSQNVGSLTNLYRKKIKEITDGMIKAPRLEKEAQIAQLSQQLNESRRALAAMERNHIATDEDAASRSAMDEATANQHLNHASDRISDITNQISKLNQEIQAMKPLEEKRLQENEKKFNKIFGDVIPTERDQMRMANELKRDSEIAAANGDPKKIERANAEFEMRKIELEAQFDKEELEDQKTQAEINEINEKSEEWGRILNDKTLSKIDTVVSIGEKITNYAIGKIGGSASNDSSSIDIRKSLDGIKESLSNSKNEHIVDQILEIGELVYHKLQEANQSLDTMYQDASKQHALKQDLHDELEKENKRFREACENDIENKMGVSLKDKRITYLNDMKHKVEIQLTKDLQDKREAKATVQNKVDHLDEKAIPDKKNELSDASKAIDSRIAAVADMEKQLDILRDQQLETYRTEKAAQQMTDEQISRSAEGIMIRTAEPSQPTSDADLIGQLTDTKLDGNTTLEDVMEQIQKINVNGIGLINYIDPNNQYSIVLSADETEQLAFRDKLLNDAGTMLKKQLGSSIISVEQDDMLLHPVLLDGNEQFNRQTKAMVADFNSVRLESAKLNVKNRTIQQSSGKEQNQQGLSIHDEQKRQVLDKAVKQSRSRVSLSSLMGKEHMGKENKEHRHTRDHTKDARQTSMRTIH